MNKRLLPIRAQQRSEPSKSIRREKIRIVDQCQQSRNQRSGDTHGISPVDGDVSVCSVVDILAHDSDEYDVDEEDESRN